MVTACENKNHCQKTGPHTRETLNLAAKLPEFKLFRYSNSCQSFRKSAELWQPSAQSPEPPSAAAASILEEEVSFGRSSAHLPSTHQELAGSSPASCSQRHIICRREHMENPRQWAESYKKIYFQYCCCRKNTSVKILKGLVEKNISNVTPNKNGTGERSSLPSYFAVCCHVNNNFEINSTV